ncbi:uncharacterized protein B0T15DRAFT_537301 [Chaetomium strumarium]|uniref:Extracellular membrane protein CFEM domain-containing protein n=1 Tax=Chaetomium strumarium TaxID=1170767 RepID=A0AAJ0GR90_9PEZI|nr:hypothetical protein B0T15DRAFT_537301 [Chaetomium strumarium]
MASMLATATRTLSILLCLGKVFARSELGVIFGHTEGYNQLNSNQRSCGVSSVYSPCYGSPCRDKSCFCANPQFISDETDKCMIHYDFMYDGMYSVDTYNGIMAFFGKECGTFEVQFKQVASESITYTTGFTHPLPSTAGNVVTTSATGRPSTSLLRTSRAAKSVASDQRRQRGEQWEKRREVKSGGNHWNRCWVCDSYCNNHYGVHVLLPVRTNK